MGIFSKISKGVAPKSLNMKMRRSKEIEEIDESGEEKRIGINRRTIKKANPKKYVFKKRKFKTT